MKRKTEEELREEVRAIEKKIEPLIAQRKKVIDLWGKLHAPAVGEHVSSNLKMLKKEFKVIGYAYQWGRFWLEGKRIIGKKETEKLHLLNPSVYVRKEKQ